MPFKIGEASRLLGVSTQSIRAYEEAGILTPHRSENGTRYFDEWDLIRLMSFKKYREMELSIAEIIGHFQDDTLDRFSAVLASHAGSLRRRAEALLRVADAVDEHKRVIDLASEALQLTDSPAHYRLDDLVLGLGQKEYTETLGQWIKSLPAMVISPVISAANPLEQPRWALSVSEEDAARWGVGIHLNGVKHIPSRPSARAPVAVDMGIPMGACIEPVIRELAGQGVTLDETGEIWGRQVSSETIDGMVRLHYILWIPIYR